LSSAGPPDTPIPRGSGAGRVAGVRLASAVAAFGLQLVLARLMTPAEFGALVVVMTWVGLAASLGSLSLPLVVVRFVADYVARGELGAAKAVWRYSLIAVLGGSLAATVLLLGSVALGWVRLPGVDPGSWPVLGLLLVAGPLLAVASGQLQGLQRVVTAELLSNLARTGVVILSAVLLALLASRPPRVVDMLWIHLTAALLLGLACWAWARSARPLGWSTAASRPDPRRWRETAAGFFGVMLVGALCERIDMLVMGQVGAPDEIARYAVVTRFSQALAVLVVAAHGGLAPRVAAHLVELQAHRPAALQAEITRVARIAALLTGAMAVGFAVLGSWLLALFGSVYREAAPALALLGAGFFVACLFGPGLLAMTLIGHTRRAMASLAAGALVSAFLVVLLGPRWGATGAALGAAMGTVLPPVLGWWWLRRRWGLDAAVWARAAQ
jgi:O-antigen/teichoic acid export membrane protein